MQRGGQFVDRVTVSIQVEWCELSLDDLNFGLLQYLMRPEFRHDCVVRFDRVKDTDGIVGGVNALSAFT